MNEVELESPLWALRPVLGDERVNELGGLALELAEKHPTVEERVCLAEHLRLFACASAKREAKRVLEVA